MKTFTFLLFTIWILALTFCDDEFDSDPDQLLRSKHPMVNDRPIIGVLTQEYYHNKKDEHAMNFNHTYIRKPYAKFVEGGGGQVVPIFCDGDPKYLRKMLNSVNGILLPGAGDLPLFKSKFSKASRFLYHLAMELNDAGTYFPLWTECYGLQLFLSISVDPSMRHQKFRTRCNYENRTQNLDFLDAAYTSRLYGRAAKYDPTIIEILSTKKATTHYHHFCITTHNFKKFKVDKTYRVLTTNYDELSQSNFVSSVESIKYPFYALGFHPEKSLYQFTTNVTISHSSSAIKSSQYFARFFVDEARRNEQSFESEKEEERNLIYNFKSSYYKSGDEIYWWHSPPKRGF